MQYDELDREGLIALAAPLAALVDRVATAGGAWIDPQVQRAFQAVGLTLGRNHFYSIFPDLAALPERLWNGPVFAAAWSQVPRTDYRTLLSAALAYLPELAATPREAVDGFHWNNPMFPPLDAAVYYGLIRALRPARILEVGSGFSTLIALAATAANGLGSVECVEPYPGPTLITAEDRLTALHRIVVQNAPDVLFSSLRRGDVLFIDTSHTLKAGSDVNDILFRILPLLRPGVLIHMHDIFLPYEYPKSWFRDIGIVWNEQYAVLALLMNSNRYRVVLPNYLASIEEAACLAARFEGLEVHGLTANMGGTSGASLWFEVCGQSDLFG